MGGAYLLGDPCGLGDADITKNDIGDIGGDAEDWEEREGGGVRDDQRGGLLHLHL